MLDTISRLISDTVWLAPLLAFLGGMVVSFSPCSLSSVPLIISYVGGTGERDTRRAFWLSVTFTAGSAVTFTTLGVLASLAGNLIGSSNNWWYLLLGSLMVLMSFQVWGLFEIIPSGALASLNRKRGFLGAFLVGILGGLFSSPCATPVLVALLAIVAEEGNVLWGGFLLLLYSIGHGILAIAAGTSISFAQRLSDSERYSRISTALNIILGALILGIGLYMFYLGF